MGPRSNRHVVRRLAAGIAVGAVLGGLLAAVPAAGIAPRAVSVNKVASIEGRPLSVPVVDRTTGLGWLIDYVADTVEVYDFSTATPTRLAVLGPLDDPQSLDVDEETRRVVVSGGKAGWISAIDADPASPTVYSVLGTFTTGPTPAWSVLVGPNGVAYANRGGSGDVFSIDLATGRQRDVHKGSLLLSGMTIDPASGTLFISDFYDESIAVIAATGTTKFAVEGSPQALAFDDGLLHIGTLLDAGIGRVDTYDPASGRKLASSAEFPGLTREISVDHDDRFVFAVTGQGADHALRVLRAGTLASEYTSAIGNNGDVSADPARDRIYVRTENDLNVLDVEAQPVRGVDRIGGADRFAVSAAVSADTFSPGVPVAYVASGSAFPDALSGGAAAGTKGGPVLLVGRDGIPASVGTELERLKPQRIVVLGGPASVARSVQTALGAYSKTVTRIEGADRFDVAAAVSAATFEEGTPTAYVASGAVFSDALSGSAAGGHLDGPVLLVGKDRIPESISAELARLKPAKIVVLGGTATVSDSVVASLTGRAPTTRVAGADRFEVSAGVSSSTFGDDASTVYIASGAVFPDALSGSAAAARHGAPVLLVTSTGIPPSVVTELDRIRPTRIVVLGGPTTVSPTVEAALAGHLQP